MKIKIRKRILRNTYTDTEKIKKESKKEATKMGDSDRE